MRLQSSLAAHASSNVAKPHDLALSRSPTSTTGASEWNTPTVQAVAVVNRAVTDARCLRLGRCFLVFFSVASDDALDKPRANVNHYSQHLRISQTRTWHSFDPRTRKTGDTSIFICLTPVQCRITTSEHVFRTPDNTKSR